LLRTDSQNADLYFALGNAYQQMQDWDNAGEAYTRAIQLEPDFAYANGQLSFMYYTIGDTRGARSAAEMMIRLAPESGDAHKFLSLSMERAGDYDGALQEFTKAITLEPKSAATYYYDIGVVRADQKEWSAAIAAYLNAIQVGPTRWPFYNNLGIALGRMNRVDEAVAAFEKGKVLAHRLKGDFITMPQLEAAGRKQGFESLSEVDKCVLEPGGTLTFVGKKPATEDVRHKELLDRLDLLTKEIVTLRGSQPPARA